MIDSALPFLRDHLPEHIRMPVLAAEIAARPGCRVSLDAGMIPIHTCGFSL